MLVTQYTGQEFTLAQDIEPNIEYSTIAFTITETPSWTGGIVKVDIGDNSEWFVVEDLALVEGDLYQADVITRAFAKDATTTTATDAELSFAHSKGAVCKTVTHSYIWDQKWLATDGITLSDDNTFTGTQTFQSDTKTTFIVQDVTTAQRDLLTDVSLGAMVYNSTTEKLQYYNGAWVDVPTGDSNKNASETEQGKVGLATPDDHRAGAEGTLNKGAMAIQPKNLLNIGSTEHTDDAYKIAMLNSTGKLGYTLVSESSRRFGGNGLDGVLNASENILGDDNSYIVKNYRSVSAGAFTLSTNARNSIIHIKVEGDADFTNWTFDFDGVGGIPVDGAPFVNTAGPNGMAGLSTVFSQASVATGGSPGVSTGGANPPGGVAPTSIGWQLLDIGGYNIPASCGGAGGGGGGGYSTFSPPQALVGGDSGAGGGCVIVEVAGNVTFSSTTVDVSGLAGETGADSDDNPAVAIYDQSGGGGGGAGGTFICLYAGTLTGSPTIYLDGGAGGVGGTLLGANFVGKSGAGGGGGSNIFNTGTNGGVGTTANTAPGGAGGDGADGVSYIGKASLYA